MSAWVVFAFFGAVLWGLHYPLLEKALNDFQPLTIMFITSSVMTIVIICIHKDLFSELKVFYEAGIDKKLIVLGIILTEFLAVYLITRAVSEGNATYVSLIEISYPIFVVIFTYVIFKVNHFTPQVVVGALLIFMGSGVIVMSEGKEAEKEIAVEKVIL
jgi:drug/metabolite transporter (DMT)-like permease